MKIARDIDLDLPLAIFIAIGALLANYGSTICESFPQFNSYAATKPYKSFDTFYPFYLQQHADEICRRLHFIGTSICVLIICFDVNIAISMLAASVFGIFAFELTRSLSSGIIEALVVITVFLQTYRRLSKSINKALLLLAVGYGFAWVGHFFFEKNRPATFIYPIYSLAGDFKMWYEIASQQRRF